MKNTTNKNNYRYKVSIINAYLIKTMALNSIKAQRNQYQCSKPLHPIKIFALWFLRISNYIYCCIKSISILFIRINGIFANFENLKLSGILKNISNKRSCL